MIVGLKDDAWLRMNPPHPGRAIRTLHMESIEDDAADMTVGEAAAKLGVSRVSLSRVINGHAGISLDMALKLETAGWGIADSWMELQTRYDVAQARKRRNQPRESAPAIRHIERLKTEAAASP